MIWRIIGFIALLAIYAFGIASVFAGERVIASTYNDGTRDPRGMTAAHKTLPFGTRLTLTLGHTAIVVTINDRGPFIKGRTLDLTPAANKALHCGGLCRLRVESWPPLPRPKPDDRIAWGVE